MKPCLNGLIIWSWDCSSHFSCNSNREDNTRAYYNLWVSDYIPSKSFIWFYYVILFVNRSNLIRQYEECVKVHPMVSLSYTFCCVSNYSSTGIWVNLSFQMNMPKIGILNCSLKILIIIIHNRAFMCSDLVSGIFRRSHSEVLKKTLVLNSFSNSEKMYLITSLPFKRFLSICEWLFW